MISVSDRREWVESGEFVFDSKGALKAMELLGKPLGMFERDGEEAQEGVNIENTARHPSAIGVAVNVGCWSHRRGHIIFDKDLNYTITTHSEVTL